MIDKDNNLDNQRIGVYGGSYGGYMVLASMTHYNDRLSAAVDVVGISNFVTFLKNTKSYRRDLRRSEYGDERIPEMRKYLNQISPNNNAEKITKPIFIVQGYNDPRVPYTEAEQMRDIIRSNGGDVWYMVAMDEGHGFRKHFNRAYYINAVSVFFKKQVEKHCLKVEYFFVASINDLIPVSKLEFNKKYRFFVAVFAGKTRLIDTIELNRK